VSWSPVGADVGPFHMPISNGSLETWADAVRGKGVKATEQGLRRVFQAIGRETCFGASGL
jgi:hypothetical protein